MWAETHRARLRRLRELALATLLVVSSLAVMPYVSHQTEAAAPVFTRPNVLVDKGPGPILAGTPGAPGVASDIDGVLHAAWSDGRSGTDIGIYYSHSYDDGATWTGETRIDTFLTTNSWSPSIAVDTSRGPYSGHIYVAWQWNRGSLADIYVVRSVDGGTTWTDKHRVDTAMPDTGSLFPVVAVDTDGTVYIAFEDRRSGNTDIYMARSDDGGASWQPEMRATSGENGDTDASLVAYGGTVYLGWTEAGPVWTIMWLATSADKGKTWEATNVTDAAGCGLDTHSFSIAVGTDGTVRAVWVEKIPALTTAVFHSQSRDGGRTWSSPVYVSDHISDTGYSINSVSTVQSSGVLYAIWADNRNGDYDVFSSWSQDGGMTWGDGLFNDNDVRVDDTDENGVPTDDSTPQMYQRAVPGPTGIYVVWLDCRDLTAYHLYFAGFLSSDILITEIGDSPNGLEQVEIHNALGIGLDLTGHDLVVGGTRIDLGPLGVLPPRSYRTIGDPVTSDLVADITLGDEGDMVEVYNQSDLRDSAAYGQMGPIPDPLDSESVWLVPSVGGGGSLWARTTSPSMGAPNGGRLPVAMPEVVLNEIYLNTLNPDERFIELCFRGTGSINVTGYIVVGDSPYSLPSTTLTDTSPFGVVRPMEAPSLFSTLDISGDNVYLYDPGGAFVDMVGWSSSNALGTSMARVPDGFGTADGFDDTTSFAAGWRFGQVPTPVRVSIEPRQSKSGDAGDRVFYELTATNKDYVTAYVNIQAEPGPKSWQMTLFQSDGVTPLTDSPGDPDSVPDVGLLLPGESSTLQVSVDIPQTLGGEDREVSAVVASPASYPSSAAKVTLTTVVNPYLYPTASANPQTIWLETAPPGYQPKEATLAINLTGRGNSIVNFKHQDTVFMIDSSGSMYDNDRFGLRLMAAKHYVDLLTVPDRAAVIDFNNETKLVGGDHLSSNYTRIKSNIDTIGSSGFTDLLKPIEAANDELTSYGNKSQVWIEIMLTDGADTCGNSEWAILAEANRAKKNGIVIFTIGLVGQGGVDEDILKKIASLTGGTYMRAVTATDLDGIFLQIGKIVRNLAGYDENVTDSVPMVSVYLPDHITYVAGSASPLPAYLGTSGGETNIQWNISRLNINQTWKATFRVTSSENGTDVEALSYPSSRVTYNRYDDLRVTVPIPQVLLEVLAPPPPQPVLYTITRSPLLGKVSVDGLSYSAPATFLWLPGEQHTIGAPDTDVVAPGERWAFVYWDDGGNITHDIIVVDSNKTICASYLHQFEPIAELLGLDVANNVSAHFTSRAKSIDEGGQYGTWSDWVDEGTALSFDALGSGSNSQERWMAIEDFGLPPWISVSSAFVRSVLYWHQVTQTVVLQGLPPSSSLPIEFTSFGSAHAASSSSVWTDWADNGSLLMVGGRLTVSPAERYVNIILPDDAWLQWNVTSPATHVVPFLHQFKPTAVLTGIGGTSCVSSHFIAIQKVVEQPCVSGTWSEWVDKGTPLSFDALSVNSGPSERWITLEEFQAAPWNAVSQAFYEEVYYWHQFNSTVRIEGLPTHLTVPIDFIQFGVSKQASSNSLWSDWLDNGTLLQVGGRVVIPPAERYINTVVKDAEMLAWTVNSPASYTVPFLHQFKPTVFLIGTDDEHSVNVSYRDSSGQKVDHVADGLSVSWTSWADEGTEILFSNRTTGDPPYFAKNQTLLSVDSAFTAYIVYAPAATPPPTIQQPNYKPLISLLFVVILIAFGMSMGYTRPWDIHELPQRPDAGELRLFVRGRTPKGVPLYLKLNLYGIEELRKKFTWDRTWTVLVLVTPFSVVEALIGIASLLTGFLSVPEAGNWLSMGLIVNSILLGGGIVYDLLMRWHGYKVPSREMIVASRLQSNQK